MARSEGAIALRVLLLFTAVNLLVAVAALPHLPGNPRYLLFLMAPLPVFLACLLARGRRRYVLAALVALGAAASLAQAPSMFRNDAEWRRFVAELESAGVRWCYTDFHLATKVNFLSEERIICSAKLGPTMTEYFVEYRERVRGRRRGGPDRRQSHRREQARAPAGAAGRDLGAARPAQAGAAAPLPEGPPRRALPGPWAPRQLAFGERARGPL